MNAVVLVHAPRPAGLVLSPRDDVGLAARAVVRFHLRAFDRFGKAARAGEAEPIDQLRVTTRRLRAYARRPGVHVGSVLPAGALIQALARREAKRRRQGLKLCRKLERSGLLEEVITALAEPARDGPPAHEANSA